MKTVGLFVLVYFGVPTASISCCTLSLMFFEYVQSLLSSTGRVLQGTVGKCYLTSVDGE